MKEKQIFGVFFIIFFQLILRIKTKFFFRTTIQDCRQKNDQRKCS